MFLGRNMPEVNSKALKIFREMAGKGIIKAVKTASNVSSADSASGILTGEMAQKALHIAGNSAGRTIAAGKNVARKTMHQCDGYTNPIKRAKGILKDFAQNGIEIDGIKIETIDMERIPRLYNNREGILPSKLGGAYSSALNRTILTNEKGANKWSYPMGLYETVSHEGTHGFLANIRAAFAHQHPEEYEKTLLEIIDKSVRKGEQGVIIKGYKAEKGFKGLFQNTISSIIPENEKLIPKDKHLEFLEEIIVKDFSGTCDYAVRANKYATSRLTEKATAKIKKELVPLMADQSPESQQKLINQIESELPQLFSLKPRFVKIAEDMNNKIEFMKAPELSSQERVHIADFVGNILQNKERFTKTVSETEPPQLTENAKHIIEKELIPKLKEFTSHTESTKKATEIITDYLHAQITRLHLLKNTSIASSTAEKLPSIGKALTGAEKQLAKKSLENSLACLEGNARLVQNIKKGKLPDEDTIMQYMFNWEELQARRMSYRYMAGKLDKKIERLQLVKHPSSKQAESQLQEAQKSKEEFKNNLKLLDLIQERMQLKQKTSSAPKDGKTLEKIAALKTAIQDIAPKSSIPQLPAHFFRTSEDQATNIGRWNPMVSALEKALKSGKVKTVKISDL